MMILGISACIFLALLFGLVLRFSSGLDVPAGFNFIISSIVIINLALALFNLVPIPPLDGSKIFFEILPEFFKLPPAKLPETCDKLLV